MASLVFLGVTDEITLNHKLGTTGIELIASTGSSANSSSEIQFALELADMPPEQNLSELTELDAEQPTIHQPVELVTPDSISIQLSSPASIPSEIVELSPTEEIGSDVLPDPEPLESNLPPRYPIEALSKRIEGTVMLTATVEPQGTISKLIIESSSGSDFLDQAALDAVTLWKFHPFRQRLLETARKVSIPIVFRIKANN